MSKSDLELDAEFHELYKKDCERRMKQEQQIRIEYNFDTYPARVYHNGTLINSVYIGEKWKP